MKKTIIALVVMVITILGSFGFIIWSDMKDVQDANKKESEETASTSELEEMREALGGTVTDEEMEEYEQNGLNPFGQLITIEQLTDVDYQEYIHGMSHQKVKAEQKWGFYQINAERINWLLAGLNNTSLQYSDVYQSILEKWASGDFSTADKDHNKIWQIQGGTIGEATGLLSPEEEKAYIESQ